MKVNAKMTRYPDTRAFTLIELLTVIAIIGILAAILIPVIGTVREKAHVSVCRSNLREVGKAATMYALENNEELPRRRPGQSGNTVRTFVRNALAGLLVSPPYGWGEADYLESFDVLFCPRNHSRFDRSGPRGLTWDDNIGYGWYYIIRPDRPDLDNTRLRDGNHNHVLASDLDGRAAWIDNGWAPHPPSINVLRLGGHVTTVQQDWIVQNGLHSASLVEFVEAMNAHY